MEEEKKDIPEEVSAAAETEAPDLSEENGENTASGKKGFAVKKKASGDSKELKKLKEELDQIKAELEESQNRYMRLAAEYDNYKKRTAKELDARYSDAKLDIMKEILPVLDNFERGLAAECSDSA